jgi:uncharacterized membrane protein YjjB (DUF3815 family)
VLLAAGITAAAKGWALFTSLPSQITLTPLPTAVVLAILAIGGVALAAVLQASWRDLPWVIGGVWLAFGSQALAKHVTGGHAAPLFSAFVLGIGAQLMNRITHRTPAIVVVPGLLQLAPGYLGTTTILHALAGKPDSQDTFGNVMLVAGQLTIGLLIASILFRPRARPSWRPARASSTHA